MKYLIRFVQVHETFRRPEIEALAHLAEVPIAFYLYNQHSPYSIVDLPTLPAAQAIIQRSISSKAIYELWGSGTTYTELHESIQGQSSHLWPLYREASFRFTWDTFQGSRPLADQMPIINSFSYLNFQGPIRLKDADETFTIFEDYDYHPDRSATLQRLYFGRFIAESSRRILDTYTLKKRQYINTTSMDSELALLTANITLARPNTLFYDPFVGTGSFPLACSHFGARTLGSDIDGRMVRGRDGQDIRTNFQQYGILDRYLDGFISDLTHTPLRLHSRSSSQSGSRNGRWLDGIICDPPYGVREGLKVLGSKDSSRPREAIFINGEASHLQDHYIPPKRAYSLEAMLHDILVFAASTLVDEGRVSLWMPTANDEDVVLAIPEHPALERISICVQVFNKWSRRLLTYRRLPGVEVEDGAGSGTGQGAERGGKEGKTTGTSADELNDFRRRYFQGFRVKQVEDSTSAE